ncbi:MAG: hypothetical protein ABF273_03050 [Wenyingzhuangia sp.]|uniref:hypothetical protein n=1 Tax=Wenyingzhuangia sp. TaxID=1964193 RepID=UPI003219721F
MKEILILFLLLVGAQSLKAQNDYCRWGVCKWGNDCMEGPSYIYGDHHPGCKTQWIKNNPEKWAKIQRQEAAILGAAFGLFLDRVAADNKKRDDEIKRLQRLQYEEDNKYVQEVIKDHISYSASLNEIYNDPIRKRNFVIKLLQTTNVTFSYANYLKFSDKNNLVAFYENKNNKPFYSGSGTEYRSTSKLPSQYQFMPQGGLPYIYDLNEYNQLVAKHHSNLDVIKKVFNDTRASDQNILKKFQIFKTLGLKLDRFHKTNSFEDFIRTYTLEQKKSIIDFRKQNLRVNQSIEIAFFLNDFKLNFNQNNDLWNYFLGKTKNHSALSASQKNKIVSQNIINYTSTFEKDMKAIPQHMRNILRYEDMLLNQVANRYQYSGIRNKAPKYWSYRNSLLSPRNRYMLFKDFAMIYDRLIVDREIAIKTWRPVKYKKNHQLELSLSDYLKNEPLYLAKLIENDNNIVLDVKKGCLVFSISGYKYETIKTGVPVYEAVEAYNNGSRYKLLDKYDLLKGLKELEKQEELVTNLDYSFNPHVYSSSISDVTIYDTDFIKSMIGYSIGNQTLTTYWDYSLLTEETSWSFHVSRRELVERFHRDFLGEFEDDRGDFRQEEFKLKPDAAYTTYTNKEKSIEQRKKEHSKQKADEGFMSYLDRTESYTPNVSDIRCYLGDTKDDDLRANGEAIDYFISKTKNIHNFPTYFESGVLLPELLANIKVSIPENQKRYIKGLNLYIKTLPLNKANSHLNKYYTLIKIERSKKEIRQLKKANGTIQTIKYKLIESTNYGQESDGDVEVTDKVSKTYKTDKESKKNYTLTFDPKRIKQVKINSNKTKVIYFTKENITDIIGDIEIQLEQVYGGDWYLEKGKRKVLYYASYTFKKKT